MSKITDIRARQILDSREKPTLEVEVATDDGVMAADSVPSGTSTGSFEAMAIEPKIAVENINKIIKPKLIGQSAVNQSVIDQILIDLDGTKNKSNLGANAILGVSLAVARAGAMSKRKPLYLHLNELYRQASEEEVEMKAPTPMMVMIEGGKHAKNNLCIQEFSVCGELEDGKKIWQILKKILLSHGVKPELGLEGGFTPHLKYDEEAIDLILMAIKEADLMIGTDVQLSLDVAGNHCQMNENDILAMIEKYPIYSLEDPVGEDDWDKWVRLMAKIKKRGRDFLLIGDDLFVTNKERLQKGINNSAANAIIIKLNQVGTLWETLKVIALAKKAGFAHILSHRSGETMDTFMADLAVATAAKMMKSGAPFASERVVKYNRLKEIEEELQKN